VKTLITFLYISRMYAHIVSIQTGIFFFFSMITKMFASQIQQHWKR